jgi:D-alanine transfer protein
MASNPTTQTAAGRVHLLAAGIAVGIVLLALLVFDLFAGMVERRVVHDITAWSFAQKLQGRAMQAAAFQCSDLLPVYGSSELLREAAYVSDYHASKLFSSYPTGFDVFPIGKAQTGNLIHLQMLASVGSAAAGKKVIVSLTPNWFFDRGEMLGADAYAGNFSPLHAYSLAFGRSLGTDVTREAATRMLDYPQTLEQDPLLRFGIKCLASQSPLDRLLYYTALPMGQLQLAVLRLQDHFETMLATRGVTDDDARLNGPTTLDWPRLAVDADRIYRDRCTNNPFGLDSERWLDRFAGEAAQNQNSTSDSEFRQALDGASGWWTDLDLLLRGLRDLGAQPLVLSLPIDGPWYDYCGVSVKARGQYYAHLRDACARYGVPVLDFSDHDSDRFFATDMDGHLSPKGWIYFSAAMNAFFNDLPYGAEHSYVIPPQQLEAAMNSPSPDNRPPDYQRADGDGVAGWVYDANRPDAPMSVDLLDGDRLLCTIRADVYDQNLVARGIGNGRHVFQTDWPAELRDGKPHVMGARVHNSDVALAGGGRSVIVTADDAATTRPQDAVSSGADTPPATIADDPGTLDEVNDDGIRGWAWDPQKPDDPVTVQILDGQTVIASFAAVQHRDDLTQADKGNGRHGFDVAIPAVLRDGRMHTVFVRIAARADRPPVNLVGSPRQYCLASAASTAPADDLGTLDGIADGRISGWAWDPDNPDRPVTVELLADGHLVLAVVADELRDDLAQAGKGNGRHGFDIPVPQSLGDGNAHKISVRIKGSSAELNDSPATFTGR